MKWRSEALHLVDEAVAKNEAFSASHLAKVLRSNRSTAAFDLDSLSDYIRDLFYAGSMGSFVQVAHKQGFAYAPTEEQGRDLSVVVRVPSRKAKAANPFMKATVVAAAVSNSSGATFAAVHMGNVLHVQRSTVDDFYRVAESTPGSFAVEVEPGSRLRLKPDPEGPAEVELGSLRIPITSEPGTQYPVKVSTSHIEVDLS